LGWQVDQIVASFERLVEEINNGRSQPNTSLIPVTDEDVREYKLVKVCSLSTAAILCSGLTLVQMSQNPFLLFTTYINTYMQSLEAITGTNQNLIRKDASRSQRTTDADLKSWLLGKYKPMKTPKYTEPQKTARRAINNAMNSMIKTEDPLYLEEDKHSSTWRIGVSWDKVEKADGKRIGEYAPKEIIGMSANVVSLRAIIVVDTSNRNLIGCRKGFWMGDT
jgi:hypothetical protein